MPSNRAVSQNYQSHVSIQRGHEAQEGMPLNSVRSKTPNDHAFSKTTRHGDLSRHLRLLTGTNVQAGQQQRRIFNGSVDFNQTENIGERYLRDIRSYNRLTGSVSPTQYNNPQILTGDAFALQGFDNLNQTVQLTLGTLPQNR